MLATERLPWADLLAAQPWHGRGPARFGRAAAWAWQPRRRRRVQLVLQCLRTPAAQI
jgi:hypothetical protein